MMERRIRLVEGPTSTPDWMEYAACRGLPPDWWFPDESERALGKPICMGCPVKDDCLDHALAEREYYGIWGGLGRHERRQVALERHIATPARPRVTAPCGTEAGFKRHRRAGEDACRACLEANAAAKQQRTRTIVWSNYGPCHACGVPAGAACVSLGSGWQNVTGKRAGELKDKPHPGRKPVAA